MAESSKSFLLFSRGKVSSISLKLIALLAKVFRSTGLMSSKWKFYRRTQFSFRLEFRKFQINPRQEAEINKEVAFRCESLARNKLCLSFIK